jgi:CDP-diacylglycerol---serine O-phosphatidyltransferase
MTLPRTRPRGMRRAIVILPSAFTSGNLFFGVWSIVEASRGEFLTAAWFIVVAAVLDLLDGRIARMSRSGTSFGAELDSLVDVISFGIAPALLLFFWQFHGREWAWLLSFFYVLAATLRLARFNVVQAGRAKTHFIGLSSPISGITLASLYPFTQTTFFQQRLGFLPLPLLVVLLTIGVSLLMVSQVPYPVVPRVGLRSWKGRVALAAHLAALAGALYFPEYFFFPACVTLILFGLVRAVFMGLLDRLPERDPLRDDEEEPERVVDYDLGPGRAALRLGRRRRPSSGPRAGGDAL